MDLTSNNTHTLDSDTKTPPPTQPTNTNKSTLKSLSLTNATHNNHSTTTTPPHSMAVISYKECLKNHAATIGGHALDGCGEFMPSSSTNPTDPRSLKCAACGCHRNFHRRDPPEPSTTTTTPTFLNCFYSPSTAAPPPPPPQPLPHRGMSQSTSPSLSSSPSHSPSPMSSPSSPPPLSHVPPPPPPPPSSAPHMLLALGNAYSAVPSDQEQHQLHRNSFNNSNKFSPVVLGGNHSSKNKRYRTKFSQEQKEKMYKFSEKLGWRMNNKGDDSLVQDFCNDIGVPRGVFKVWMHNNKNTFNKKISSSSEPPPPPANNNNLNEPLLLPPHDQKINGGSGDDGHGSNNTDKNGSNKNSVNNVVAHVPINGLSS